MTIVELNATIVFFNDTRDRAHRARGTHCRVTSKLEQSLPRSGTRRSKTFQLAMLWCVFSAKKIGITTSLCANWSKNHPSMTVHVLDQEQTFTDSCRNSFGFLDFPVTITRCMVGGAELGAWTVDEKSVYRQIPAHFGHRQLSVIACSILWIFSDPSDSVLVFGHLFSEWAASTVNCCRRSDASDKFLIRFQRMASLSFFDDKFAFSRAAVVQYLRERETWFGVF